MNRMRSLSLSLLLSLFSMVAMAQDTGTGSPYTEDTLTVYSNGEESSDTSSPSDILGDTTLLINPIGLNADSFNRWRREEAYGYMADLDSQLRERKKGGMEKDKTNGSPRSYRSGSNSFLDSAIIHALLWILAGLFVLFIIYRLFLSKGMFVRYAQVEKVQEEEMPDAIHESDFRQRIRQAVTQGDYRKAVRYQYLYTLQRLSEKDLIHVSAEKTDAAYVREVPPALRSPFASLTLLYQYVWYGQQQVSESMYQQFEKEFTSFNV